MEYLHVHTASFLAIIIIFSTCPFGQTETVTGPEGGAIEAGQDAVLTCVPDAGTSSFYTWDDVSGGGSVRIFTSGGKVSSDAKYNNFDSSTPGNTMTITGADVEDEGQYECATDISDSPGYTLTVEVGSTLTMTLSTTDPLLSGMEYTATCDVVGSRPQLNISWTLNDIVLGVTPVVTNPTNSDPDLSNTRSEVTLTPTPAMNGQDLKCTTTGHVVTSLNREAATQLSVQYAPTSETATIVADATINGDNKLLVTCQVSTVVDGVASANPAINNYTIYAGSEQIHSSTTDSSVLVDIPENATDYKCTAGNDLGTIESGSVNYDPGRTTTQPTTTGGGLTIGATVGIVIGVLLLIALVVVLVVFLVKKKDSGPPPKTMALQEQKPTNGNSEKVAHPTAAPRQSTVPHRNDNPGGAVYAEVQKGGRGYDQPDHTHPPQADSGMNYATLDLSEEAGHTERQVPQNKDNVVVYSSVLV